jgi:tRNA(Ile)-lysidine synthase TilS/MesJ
MKYHRNVIYNFLEYWADKQPHRFIDQANIFSLAYKKDVLKLKLNIVKLLRYCVQNQWIEGVGSNFYATCFPFRRFMLTDKGDEFFRILAIEQGGNFSYYRYFDREKNKEWKKSKIID